jgi:hypothetical protein
MESKIADRNVVSPSPSSSISKVKHPPRHKIGYKTREEAFSFGTPN